MVPENWPGSLGFGGAGLGRCASKLALSGPERRGWNALGSIRLGWLVGREVEIAHNPVVNQLLLIVTEHPKHLGLLSMNQAPETTFLHRLMTFDPAPFLQSVQKVRNLCRVPEPLINGTSAQAAVVGMHQSPDSALLSQVLHQFLIQIERSDHRQTAFAQFV